jgi:hypothetical protein
MLEDCKSVQAPAEFVAQLSEAVTALRALWSETELGEALAKRVKTLESLCALPTPERDPEPAPERRGFWK